MEKYLQIKEIGKVITGKTPSTEDASNFDGKYPFITPFDIKSFDEKYLLETERTLSEKGAKKLKNNILPKDSICFVCIGSTIGKMCLTNTIAYSNQQINSLIVNNNFDAHYMFYFLRYVKSYFQQLGAGTGSGKGIVNKTTFEKSKVKVETNKNIQVKIAGILSAYDNLIENNNKRIRLLEQMAENLYKEWFVRFRFPGYEDVEFEDGLPKEWKICRIDQLSKIKAGGDAPDDSTKEITDECSIPIYSNGIENEGLYGYTSKAKINKPSISISARGTVGYTCLRRVSYTPIVRLICIIPHEEKLANWLFYYFKRTIVIANGTSQQQITIPMMSREKVLLPTNDLIQKFYEYSTCCLDEIDSLKAQNSNLKKQRDMLLPRLMSGKLEV